MLSQSEIQELMEMGIDPSSVYINNQYQSGGAVEDKYCPPGFTYDSTNDVCINDATGMADIMVQPIVSKPEEQYLLIVIPGTFTVFNPIKEIIRPIFNPCSASGVAFPTITSSIRSGSN